MVYYLNHYGVWIKYSKSGDRIFTGCIHGVRYLWITSKQQKLTLACEWIVNPWMNCWISSKPQWRYYLSNFCNIPCNGLVKYPIEVFLLPKTVASGQGWGKEICYCPELKPQELEPAANISCSCWFIFMKFNSKKLYI